MSDPELHDCPFCGSRTPGGPRYPWAVCDLCAQRATDSAGRRIVGYNVSFSGGFEARHATVDGTDEGICDEVTRSGRCQIDDRWCSIGEAYLGGVVIEAPPT